MSWNIPSEPQKPHIHKPRIHNWILIFVCVVFFNFLSVYFLLDQDVLLQDSAKTLTLYAAIPVLIYLILLAFRLFWYFVRDETVDKVWERDMPKFHALLHNWANAQIAVIDSYFLTPNDLDAKQIRDGEVLMQLNTPSRFEEQDITRHLAILFFRLRGRLLPLQAKRHEKYQKPFPFQVRMITSYHDKTLQDLQTLLQPRWSEWLPEAQFGPYDLAWLSPQEGIALLHEMTEQQCQKKEDILTLVLVHHLAQEHSSDCVGAFLLATPALLQKYEQSSPIACQSYLPRLMSSQDDSTAIDELITMQPVILQSEHLWLTQLPDTKTSSLLLHKLSLAKHNDTSLLVELPELYAIDMYLGLPSALSFWLALHFACETAQQNQSTELVMGQVNEHTLFNVVSPVLLTEKDE